jgi:sugar O-acyltransferase (sialic acid O-acetyltransferase NeuD family)
MKRNKNKIIILGAGDLGLQMAHYITHYSNDEIVGWLDDTKKRGSLINDKPILGGFAELANLNNYDAVCLGIGYKHLSFKNNLLKELESKKIKLYTFIHPTAYVDCSSKIEDGVFIYPKVNIDQRVILRAGSIINNSSIVSHDSLVGRCTFIAPGVNIAGNVQIGECCFLGIGSTIIDNTKIGNSVNLGAKTLISKDILEQGTYVGGPKLKRISK